MTLSREVRADPAAGVVDRSVYTSEKIFALEKDRIFARTWQYVCTTSELKSPGDYFTVSVADQPVLVVRGNDGEIRAFYNSCTHRGAMLTGDRCGNSGQVFKCMYHAWAFNLNGELVGVPYQEAYGPDFDRRSAGLVPVHCDTFHDLIFVALNPTVPSLLDFLGEMADHLGPYVDSIETIGRNSWTYQGNWKFWHENFRDNYHAEFTHRSIGDLLVGATEKGSNTGLTPGHSVLQWVFPPLDVEKYARGMRRYSGVEFSDDARPVGWSSMLAGPPPGGFDGPPGDFDGGFPEIQQEVLAVFPNLDIQPGPKDTPRGMKAGYLQTVTPLTVDTARIDITVYSAVDDDAAARQEALENLADTQGSWGKLSCDDTEAAYRCQVGVHGKGTRFNIFTRGVEPGNGGENSEMRDEYSLREFYRVYDQYLQDES